MRNKEFPELKLLKAGLRDVTLHTLRYTFTPCNGRYITLGIAQWLGHSTTHVTELYSHLCPGTERREIDRLDI